jgi:hypothetical protein
VHFSVRRTGRPSDAAIWREGAREGTLGREGALLFRLASAANEVWILDPRVHGEIRPFSMAVTASVPGGRAVLTIRNHVFFHHATPYMITSIPEDMHPAEHLLGMRHINRLENFPFSRLEDIDLETWGRLRRQRGTSVGTIEGLGADEFRVALGGELADLGMPLAATSYLLYSTG